LKSINFILAFPQAYLDVPVYMELPAEVSPVNASDGDQRRYILKLNKSLYTSSKLATTGFRSSVKGLSLMTLSKVKLINVSFLEGMHFSHVC
jgi:hypothetical protein